MKHTINSDFVQVPANRGGLFEFRDTVTNTLFARTMGDGTHRMLICPHYLATVFVFCFLSAEFSTYVLGEIIMSGDINAQISSSSVPNLLSDIFSFRALVYSLFTFLVVVAPNLFQGEGMRVSIYKKLYLWIAMGLLSVGDSDVRHGVIQIIKDIDKLSYETKILVPLSIAVCVAMQWCVFFYRMQPVHLDPSLLWVMLILKGLIIAMDTCIISHYNQYYRTREFLYFSPFMLNSIPYIHHLLFTGALGICIINTYIDDDVFTRRLCQQSLDLYSFTSDLSIVQFFISQRWATFLYFGGVCYPPSEECIELRRELEIISHVASYSYMIVWFFFFKTNLTTLDARDIVHLTSMRSFLFNGIDVIRMFVRSFLLGSKTFQDMLCRYETPQRCYVNK